MSEIQEMQVPQLRPDAKINIVMGSGFIAKMKKCFEHHIVGNEDQLEGLKLKTVEDYENNLTPWEETAVFFSTMMQEVLKLAQEQEQVDMVSMKDIITPQKTQEGDLDHS